MTRFDVNRNLLLYQIPEPVVIVQPSVEPVSIEDVKLQIGEDTDDRIVMIDRMIVSARRWVERYTGLALVDQTLEIRLDNYPVTGSIRIRGPLLSFVSFQYTDSDGALQTLDSDLYITESALLNHAPRIVRAYGATWPDTTGISDSLRIRWRAGFVDRTGSPVEDVSEIPAELIDAIILHVEAHVDRDERTMQMLINAAERLCNPYRVSFGLA